MYAHYDQIDRDGMPHPLHCIRVSCAQETVDRKCIALLHDAVEDVEHKVIMENQILDEFGGIIHAGVMAMTRGETESWSQYIRRVCENENACWVKLADIEDNFSPTRVDMKIAAKYPMYLEAYEKICERLGINRFLVKHL